MKNLFNKTEAEETIARIQQLSPSSTPLWGKMNVAQMLAHSCVAFELTYEPEKHKRPNAFVRFLLKLMVKPSVVGPKPYPKNGRTAPVFIIDDERDFEMEKNRLINYIKRTQDLGAAHFENKEYINFGKLTSKEWNTMFSKHIDHHLKQFGV